MSRFNELADEEAEAEVVAAIDVDVEDVAPPHSPPLFSTADTIVGIATVAGVALLAAESDTVGMGEVEEVDSAPSSPYCMISYGSENMRPLDLVIILRLISNSSTIVVKSESGDVHYSSGGVVYQGSSGSVNCSRFTTVRG